ncbi:universal stress protein [Halovenus salina]|uniref:Universal stress protein n=1 Tax=Halovenus salina TaxID=1510225 RepID=A0ABD5W1C8_9EURY|nr:universal stress protein [Halovenus salina]
MTTRVLVPYDTSEQASYALEHALGEFDDAEIVLEHVIEPFTNYTGAGGYDTTRYKQELENAEEMLETVCDRYDDDRIETLVHYGRPVHKVLQTIDEEDIDTVVIGSHGRDGATRLLLGSVAETVARRSPVPVTVVRQPADSYETPERILVPFEGSETSEHALQYALDHFEDATVTALYVAVPAKGDIGTVEDAFDALENWDDERTAHVESILSAAETVAADNDRTVETRSVDGTPEDALVEFAEQENVDRVVLGSTGRDGLSRLLLGSVAETVVRRSPVSVTVVK